MRGHSLWLASSPSAQPEVSTSEQDSHIATPKITITSGVQPTKEPTVTEKPLPDVPLTVIRKVTNTSSLSLSSTSDNKSKATWHDKCNRWWLLELLSIILAIASLAAMAGVMATSDNKGQMKYIYSQFTLNSVIASLTSLLRAVMMVAVATALSQQKWNWFSQRARLVKDLQLFDDASRGPWGSLKLVFSKIGLNLGTLGALITIGALALDTFAQQVIELKQRTAYNAKFTYAPSLARSESYTEVSMQVVGGQSGFSASLELPMLLAIEQGMLSDGSIQPNTPICTTAECSWPITPSLATCGSCTDMTSSLQSSCVATRNGDSLNCTYSLPSSGPLFWAYLDADANANASAVLFAVKSYTGPMYNESDHLYFWTGLIYDATGRKNPPVQAHACALWLCMQAYNTSVTGGIPSQSTVATWNKTTFDSATRAWVNMTDIPYTTFNMPTSKTYGISFAAVEALINRFDFYETPNTVRYERTPTHDANTYYFSSDMVITLFNMTDYSGWIEQLALSMTNRFRSGGAISTVSNGTDQGYYAGTARSQETYVHIRWLWLIYPAALVVAALVFVVATMVQTHARGVRHWKDDPLALLCCRVDEEVLGKKSSLRDLSEVKMLLTVEGEKAFMKTTG